jgi:hypothetical protein
MFTQATRAFGVWKSTHASQARRGANPGMSMLVAFGMCAFVCWLVFVLTLKLRGEFYVLENAGLKLETRNAHDPLLQDARPAALRFGVRDLQGSDDLQIVFESGQTLRFPSQETAMKTIMKSRVREMEITGLLTLIASPAISRVQIWPEAQVPSFKVSRLLKTLVDFGFDDFDIAVEVR